MPLASMRDRTTRPTSMRLAAAGGGSLSRTSSRNVSPVARRAGSSMSSSPPSGEAPNAAALIPNERIPRMLPRVPTAAANPTNPEPYLDPQPQPKPNPNPDPNPNPNPNTNP